MRVALITGGSRGFGRALADRLVGDGWAVVLDARGADALQATTADLERRGATVRAVPGDVTDPTHRRDLIAAAEALGGIDLLVNNASALGPSPLPPLAELPTDAFEEVLRTNVVAPLAIVQAALPVLRDGATIVNVTSDASVEPYEGWGGYGASKAALDHWSRVLGVERPDLHVYAFDPGDMRTQMHQDAFPGEDISDRPEPESAVDTFLLLLTDPPPNGRHAASRLAGGR